ncbi:3'(2'),5'-bisphosphate nucleotidase CysQ [Acidiferrobacter sp.]|uniref:3'(2'),5'-bisphosphate nucleotidase CysQ family protein n=1 Tax=Acidiferrobacter sp. TaxID=1872107 RepID=UPI00260F1A54|nr:3'(2'),5'-bisphosphate nucleotidase CysQ [Acidiferrobacter sp.]
MKGGYERYLEWAQIAGERAGTAILRHYQAAGPVDLKSDGSPVTPADRAAHEAIVGVLSRATPDVPVASEEGEEISGDRYWSVDPLDGTKEYVARTDAFVVNVALVEDGRPVVGVIYVPVTGECYFAAKGNGAFKRVQGQVRRLSGRAFTGGPVRVVGSARHGTEAVAALCAALACGEQGIERAALGSAWKFGWLAEGRADLYPRFGPTHTWDTAAGQCLVEESGGAVWVAGHQTLVYRHARQLNPSFMAVSDARFAWPDVL